MNSVSVEYLAIFRDLSGKIREKVLLPDDATVECLLKRLEDLNGSDFRDALMSPGDKGVNEAVTIILNEEVLRFPEDMERALSDGDRIVVGIAAFGG